MTASDPDGSTSRAHPPEAWRPFIKLARVARRPLERFLQIEAASGILLIAAAAAALAWANSAWSEEYFGLWHTPIGLRIGELRFERSLEWLINDGLMVIFFFVVGLEIRREIDRGELSEFRRAALPIAAAVGGMVAPAAIYLALNSDPNTRSGWGVPMATDIAFAVGILTLLGKRVPAALRVLLLALAVIDDLGAIVVIALFYSSGVQSVGFVIAGFALMAILLMQRFGVRSKMLYVLPGVVLWAGTYVSGVHPTIAGVLIGLVTPVRAWLGAEGFLDDARTQIASIAESPSRFSTHDFAGKLRDLDRARREALSPADHLIEALHPWVAFFIMPLFALANSGVRISFDIDSSGLRVMLAIGIALVVGKPVGVLVACYTSLRLRLSSLPRGVGPRQLVVLGIVAGVGFTMSLFIAQLAFTDPARLASAKLGVLLASVGAATIGLVAGRMLLPLECAPGIAETADEAESSTEK